MRSPLVIALLAVTALLAGTVDAIAGGGGLITLPALLTAGLPPHLALGTNKGSSVWGSGAALVVVLAGRAGRSRAGARSRSRSALVGSMVGAQLVLLISKDALRPIVIVMLFAAAVLLLVRKPDRTDGRRWQVVRGSPRMLALVIGCYDGFFGPGTGTFLIVGFVALCNRSLVRATADAKVVNFASNLAAVAAFAREGSVMWQVALPMARGPARAAA